MENLLTDQATYFVMSEEGCPANSGSFAASSGKGNRPKIPRSGYLLNTNDVVLFRHNSTSMGGMAIRCGVEEAMNSGDSERSRRCCL